jgi:phospholipase/carboxylesterase
MTSPDFIHRFVPGTGPVVLILLHGTGGDEDSVLPLGAALVPGAPMLSPRGQVLEGPHARFFRRIAEGVFDQDDLRRQTDALASFSGAVASAAGSASSRSDFPTAPTSRRACFCPAWPDP